MNTDSTFDVLVIGGGIAGVSLAAEVAKTGASVALVEAESQPGYHSTGRSAAYFAPAYGNEAIRSLTRLSEPVFRSPDSVFHSELIHPRPSLFIGTAEQSAALAEKEQDESGLEALSGDEVRRLVPILGDNVVGGYIGRDGGDLDVDAILQGYLRQFRQFEGQIFTDFRVVAISKAGGNWVLSSQSAKLQAKIIVNAAGSWADEIAGLAGLPRIGLTPLRRTAVLVDPPSGVNPAEWPMVLDAEEQFYFKPDAGQLLISPANETPSDPCDAQPEEMEVALGIDRVMQVTNLEVRRINHRWAGLRTFAPDRTLVIGFDPLAEGFFWCAGQGGYGVQTCPAAAQLGRMLMSGENQVISQLALSEAVSPARFR